MSEKAKLSGYWLATGLFSLAMSAGGVMNLIHATPQRETMEGLGYPLYLMTFLGVAKLLGVVALLTPGFGRITEWAYAGFTFDLLGAAYSHLAAGDPLTAAAPPLMLLAICALSYRWSPAGRRLVG